MHFTHILCYVFSIVCISQFHSCDGENISVHEEEPTASLEDANIIHHHLTHHPWDHTTIQSSGTYSKEEDGEEEEEEEELASASSYEEQDTIEDMVEIVGDDTTNKKVTVDIAIDKDPSKKRLAILSRIHEAKNWIDETKQSFHSFRDRSVQVF